MKHRVFLRLLGILLFSVCFQSAGYASDRAVVAPAPTPGLCDSPYPDPQGNVSFTCRGLSDQQIRLLPSLSTLVDKLLRSGVEGSVLEARSNDVLKMLREEPVAKTALPVAQKAEATPVVAAPVKMPKDEKSKDTAVEVFTYDYRGFKTSSLVGPMLVLGDEGESKQYHKLIELQKAGKWKALLKEATREIKKVPDWLTPYAFEAVALQHEGKTAEAIAALVFVDQHSKGNSDYDQARLLLKRLQPAQ
jgi:hypothetical protein